MHRSSFLHAIVSRFSRNAKLTEHSYLIVAAVFIGVLGGIGALVFRYLIQLVQFLAYGSHGHFQNVLASAPWYLRIAGPVAGGLLVGPLISRVAREVRGHGVPEVMEAVTLKDGVIRPRVAAIKIIASAVTIGVGGSVGREGPIVQIGSAAASAVGQFLKVPRHRLRTFVGCGAAAGIAATFNAPIAGALFALEIILGDIGFETFSPIVISSVTATVISHHFFGSSPAFLVPEYSLVSAWELPLYALLGIVASFFALLYIKAIYASEDLFEKLPMPESLKTAVCGLIFGVAFFSLPQVYGVGYDVIENAVAGHGAWSILLTLAFLKLAATALTLGGGFSGGIFAPSLFIGAMLGAAFGQLSHALFPAITAASGAYALVGMGAMVAAATQAPIVAIVILFEMTGDYQIILPLMISCIIATLLTASLKRESIYTLKLVRRGVDLRSGREQTVLRSLKVREVMHDDIETVPENMSLHALVQHMSYGASTYFPVVNSAGNMRPASCR